MAVYLNAQETSPENDMTLSPNPIQFLEEDTGALGSKTNAIPHEL